MVGGLLEDIVGVGFRLGVPIDRFASCSIASFSCRARYSSCRRLSSDSSIVSVTFGWLVDEMDPGICVSKVVGS